MADFSLLENLFITYFTFTLLVDFFPAMSKDKNIIEDNGWLPA